MKFTHKIAVVGFCLELVCPTFADSQKSSVSQESGSLQTQSASEAESGLQESMVEQDKDWLEAHEENGPEGARGVAMQRMSPFQIGLVVAVLAISGCMAALNRKRGLSGKPSRP